MHPTQQKILNLASSITIKDNNPRIIAKLIEIKNPQNIVHHIKQLSNNGYISIDDNHNIKVERQDRSTNEQLFQIPVCGSANAGPAITFAEENIEEYLGVPASEIGRSSKKGLFLVRVDGDSLNNTRELRGGPARTGDYALIDGNNRNPMSGDYVLSVIDGMANLKRFFVERENRRIALRSESTIDIKPIYIKEEFFQDYMINGVILRIIKE